MESDEPPNLRIQSRDVRIKGMAHKIGDMEQVYSSDSEKSESSTRGMCDDQAKLFCIPQLLDDFSETSTCAPSEDSADPDFPPGTSRSRSSSPSVPLAAGLTLTATGEVPDATLHSFHGRLLVIGMGAIGVATLPLLFNHISLDPSQVTVLTGDDRAKETALVAAEYPGVQTTLRYLTESNLDAELAKHLRDGDMCVNLSVDVSSIAVIEWCTAHGVTYVDTVIEPWAGFYLNQKFTPAQRSNYALREEALSLKRRLGPTAPTAVLTHGANPGLVSHLAKDALLILARKQNLNAPTPVSREEWAALAQRVGLRAIHISERDSQVPSEPKRHGQFVNTWSVDGFVSEACQPAELGWGTHEKELPAKGVRHSHGCGASIYIDRPGAATRVRTWAPLEGPFHGFLVTHNEAISLADYLTVGGGSADAPVAFRPTVHYAYHPCDAAIVSLHELAGKNWSAQRDRLIIRDGTPPSA
jgi:homospermidine synthase